MKSGWPGRRRGLSVHSIEYTVYFRGKPTVRHRQHFPSRVLDCAAGEENENGRVFVSWFHSTAQHLSLCHQNGWLAGWLKLFTIPAISTPGSAGSTPGQILPILLFGGNSLFGQNCLEIKFTIAILFICLPLLKRNFRKGNYYASNL